MRRKGVSEGWRQSVDQEVVRKCGEERRKREFEEGRREQGMEGTWRLRKGDEMQGGKEKSYGSLKRKGGREGNGGRVETKK